MPDRDRSDDLDMPIWTDDELLDFLDHDAPSVRRWAMERVLMIGDEDARARAVIKGLQDSDGLVANQALNNIRECDEDPPLDLLRACVSRDDSMPRDREHALGALAAYGDESARREMLDLFDRGEGQASVPGHWADMDRESFVRALHERWDESGLPVSDPLLNTLMRCSMTEFIEPLVDAIRKADGESAQELLDAAIRKTAGSYRDLPRLVELAEAGIPLVEESGAVSLRPGPDLEDLLGETAEELRRAARQKKWREAADAAFTAIGRLGKLADEEVRKLDDFAWGLELARTLRASSPPVDDEKILAREAALLLQMMALTLAVERTCRETDDLGTMFDLLGCVSGAEYWRVRRRLNELWRSAAEDDATREEALDQVHLLLECEEETAYGGYLWAIRSFEGYPLADRVVALWGGIEDGRFEEDDERDAIAFIGEYIKSHPQFLREEAAELLRSDQRTVRETLEALSCQNRRWATQMFLEALDHILRLPLGDSIWISLYDLGDPAALDRVVEEWRPGEEEITDCAAHLARLNGSFDDLPPEIQDAERAMEARAQHALAELGEAEPVDLPDSPEEEAGLRLPVRCTECGRTYIYRVDKLYVAPEVLDEEDPNLLEEVVPGRIIRCKNCGAEDRYELTRDAYPAITYGLMFLANFEEVDDMPLLPLPPRFSDGTVIKRASEAIRYMEDQAEQNPESGEIWRKLGNTCDKFDRPEKAEMAWRRAVEVDETEAEAAFSLANMLGGRGEHEEGIQFILETIERLPVAEMDQSTREVLAEALARSLEPMQSILNPPLAMKAVWTEDGELQRGKVDLRRIKNWERLGELLGQNRFESVEFTDEMPEDSPTRLEKLINRRPRHFAIPGLDDFDSEPFPTEGPAMGNQEVGRNDPCPCGSGRKYKRCCGKPGRGL